MPLAPWKLFKSWTCLKCGICCKRYTVPLSKNEAEFYKMVFGESTVERTNGKFVLRKISDKCIFQNGNLCSIQEVKPRNCKLWPFIVFKKPLNKRTAKLAEYEYNNEIFYVYIDTFCKGINAGNKSIEEAVKEAILDYLGYLPLRNIIWRIRDLDPIRGYSNMIINKKKWRII